MRLAIVIGTSSLLPSFSARLPNLLIIASSEHTKCRTKGQFANYLLASTQAHIFSRFLGNPSITKWLWLVALCIASWRRLTVIELGTILPSAMIFLMMAPTWDDGRSCSYLKSCPAERCLKPKYFSMSEHCVPFPEPGPPSTNTTRRIQYLN